MKEILLEEISKMMLMSNYDSKMTLLENRIMLFEQGMFKSFLTSFSKDALGTLAKDLESLASVKRVVGDGKMFKSTEELLNSIKTGSKEAKAVGQEMLRDVLKSPAVRKNNPAFFEMATSSYAKEIMKSEQGFAKQFKNASKADKIALLKNAKYPESTINSIMKEVEAIQKTGSTLAKDAGAVVKDVNVITKDVAKATEEVAAATGKESKEVLELVKKDSFFAKKKQYFSDLYKKLKTNGISKETLQRWKQKGFLNSAGKISWKKVALWAVAIGVGYNVLKDMLTQGGVFIDDTDTGGGNRLPDVADGSFGGTGGGTGGSTFKECTDFPYTKGCSSSVVSEVQKCLGIGADGKFGSKTQQALTAGGYGTEITKEVYDKIKEKCGTGGTTTTTTIPAPVFQDLGVNPDSITI